VTGLKALNVNLAYCTGFAELKKAESDAIMQFLNLHIHSSDDHYVRWKWAVGSIALWDNVRVLENGQLKNQADREQRITLHRVIPGNYTLGSRRGIRTTVFGEKREYESNQPTQRTIA
jgi:sulfonate dioxygenase